MADLVAIDIVVTDMRALVRALVMIDRREMIVGHVLLARIADHVAIGLSATALKVIDHNDSSMRTARRAQRVQVTDLRKNVVIAQIYDCREISVELRLLETPVQTHVTMARSLNIVQVQRRRMLE